MSIKQGKHLTKWEQLVSDGCVALPSVFKHLNYCSADNCFDPFFTCSAENERSQLMDVFGEKKSFYQRLFFLHCFKNAQMTDCMKKPGSAV